MFLKCCIPLKKIVRKEYCTSPRHCRNMLAENPRLLCRICKEKIIEETSLFHTGRKKDNFYTPLPND